MFVVYKSNKLNILLSKFSSIISRNTSNNIFEKEVIITESSMLFQYLNIFVAKKIGISGHFKCYTPYDFIWKIFHNIFPYQFSKNVFTESVMTWKIMKIIHNNAHFKFIDNDENEKFKYSVFMARLFCEYLIYRPDLINNWETQSTNNKNEKLQKILWTSLINDYIKNNQSVHHFAKFFSLCIQDSVKNQIRKDIFPNRIFIFSSFHLNESYIKILKHISIKVNVYFFYMTAYQKYESSWNKKKTLNIIVL